jgi:hypothetical protein
MRKTILVFLVLLAACKKSEDASPLSARDEKVATRNAAMQTVASGVVSEPPVTAAAPVDRMIIRTATISLIVRDTAKSVDAITSAVEMSGGYVSASNVWREGDVLHAKVTMRVPNTRLGASMAAIRAAGIRVQSETVSSEEVTQEYVDLASQVRNGEATEEELRQLLVTVRERAKKAADILEVHEHLVAIRGQIEQAKGRMRYLEQMTAFATINVELTPDAVSTPAIEPGWQALAVVKDATRSLTNAGKALATAAIWFAIYLLPVLIFIALAVLIGWKLLAAISKSSRRRLQS